MVSRFFFVCTYCLIFPADRKAYAEQFDASSDDEGAENYIDDEAIEDNEVEKPAKKKAPAKKKEAKPKKNGTGKAAAPKGKSSRVTSKETIDCKWCSSAYFFIADFSIADTDAGNASKDPGTEVRAAPIQGARATSLVPPPQQVHAAPIQDRSKSYTPAPAAVKSYPPLGMQRLYKKTAEVPSK